MLKVGLIGVGGISGVHTEAWNGFEDTQLVAVCCTNAERASSIFPDKRIYTDYNEMLEKEELDIVDICLPTFLHTEVSVKALEKGINVVCEKPISLKESDVELIYTAAEKSGAKFMVAQCLRFWSEYEFIKELIDSKKYGRILSGCMQRLSSQPAWSSGGWMCDESKSGLVPFDLHIHDLDFLVYALGIPTDVKCFRSKRPEQDVVQALYSFNGVCVICEATWYAAKIPFQASFRFQFEKAVVTANGGTVTVYTDDGQVISSGSSEKSEVLDLPRTSAYTEELRYFADCVRHNKPIEKVKKEELKAVLHILSSL